VLAAQGAVEAAEPDDAGRSHARVAFNANTSDVHRDNMERIPIRLMTACPRRSDGRGGRAPRNGPQLGQD
jgi:hypothetical protein